MSTITDDDIEYLSRHPNNADGEDVVGLCAKIAELQAEVERLTKLRADAEQYQEWIELLQSKQEVKP